MNIAEAWSGVQWRAAGAGDGAARGGAVSAPAEGRVWPRDFERRDEGRLWVRRDFAAVFDRLGWFTCRDVMDAPQPTLIRQVDHRSNARADLPSPTGGAAVRVYLKRHVDEPLRRSVFAPQEGDRAGGVTSGLHEADAVGACQRAGVPTMDIVAAGQQAGTRAGRADSFFMSEHLPGVQPADQYWAEHLVADVPPGDHALSARRAAMLAAMAHLANRLHRHGLFHRDFYWCHFMVGELVAGSPAAHLIDLQRLTRPGMTRSYARFKDLAQFVVSAPHQPVGPTRAEIAFWYAQYLDVTRLKPRHRAMLAAIGARAVMYRLKGLRA